MKKAGFVLFFVFIMLIAVGFSSAAELEINFTTFKTFRSGDSLSHIQISKLKYEPYPVNPGEYVTVWIQAENVGSEVTQDAIFRLAPEYPFSLDSNENSVREFGSLIPGRPVILEYKVRVDKDAVKGTNELKLEYSIDGKENHWLYKEFDITLADAQTDFDMVIQEVSDDEASIAIANVGKNVAYSVIVRIPEQPDFTVDGTDGQMVGNLENGDYTMVGFGINRRRGAEGSMLRVQIDYTDLFGERRSVTKEVSYPAADYSFNGTLPNGMSRQNFSQRGMTTATQTSIYQQWWFWLIIIAALFIVWKGISWIRERRLLKEEEEARKKKR
ncbi:hypothetical protein JW968_04680 [Candidatus Woesearchaeota archaeon]|nr:hypothetical protein [Candidatus Woesearchaeota archaeon]